MNRLAVVAWTPLQLSPPQPRKISDCVAGQAGVRREEGNPNSLFPRSRHDPFHFDRRHLRSDLSRLLRRRLESTIPPDHWSQRIWQPITRLVPVEQIPANWSGGQPRFKRGQIGPTFPLRAVQPTPPWGPGGQQFVGNWSVVNVTTQRTVATLSLAPNSYTIFYADGRRAVGAWNVSAGVNFTLRLGNDVFGGRWLSSQRAILVGTAGRFEIQRTF